MLNINWQSISKPDWHKEFSAKLEIMIHIAGISEESLTIIFCEAEQMRQLNRDYCKIDSVTDVLSWSYLDKDSEYNLLGEIALCFDKIITQAKDNILTPQNEALRLGAHAIAHILGYKHDSLKNEKMMVEFENYLLHAIDLPNMYDFTSL